ncbi:MAG: alpha/beta hydrolase, partial [Chloroflexi bacterium]|nr:alpha/beta hydrolase [Chloroflexota bacterium]
VTTLNLPVLVIHGERDQLVPLEQGIGIFTAVNSPKSLYTVPNAGHLNIFTVDPDTFTEQMGSFLAEHIE